MSTSGKKQMMFAMQSNEKPVIIAPSVFVRFKALSSRMFCAAKILLGCWAGKDERRNGRFDEFIREQEATEPISGRKRAKPHQRGLWG